MRGTSKAQISARIFNKRSTLQRASINEADNDAKLELMLS